MSGPTTGVPSQPSPGDQLEGFVAAYHEALLTGASVDELSHQAARLDPQSSDELKLAERVLKGLVEARGKSLAAANDLGASWSGDLVAEAGSGDSAPGAPRRLGRFVIERELGRGGLGVVFLAHDPVLNRRVALKVPRPEVLLTAGGSARFNREAEAAARLTHPNLVPVFELGTAGPVAYIASAFCTGPTLASYLRQRDVQLDARTAALLVAQLADAVHYAHTQGVLHRDIKPANVLLEPLVATEGSVAPANGTESMPFVPKLVDFGLAKIQDTSAGKTRTGVAMGTPGYMAPEQIEGRVAEVGPATDVYGLGTVLYECLTGSSPFGVATMADIYRRVLSEDPPAPRTMVRHLPRDLEAICLKCLEKVPGRRYATSAELAADLGRFLVGEPTRARPLSPMWRVTRWAQRRPSVAALLFVSMVAAISALVGAFWHSVRLDEALQASQRSEGELRQALFPADLRRAQFLLASGSHDAAAAVLNSYDTESSYGENFARKLLGRYADRKPAILGSHQGDAYEVAFSPDGRMLASAGKDWLIRLWDLDTNEPPILLCGHSNEVNALAFAPDGRWLASTGDDGSIRRWEIPSGSPLGILHEHGHRVYCLAISADGQRVLSGGEDGVVRLWDMSRNALLGSRQLAKPINDVAFDSRDRPVAAVSDSELISVLKNDASGEAMQLGRPGFRPYSVLAFAHRPLLASGGKDGSIVLFDLEKNAELRNWRAHYGEVECLALSRDEELLITGGRDGAIRFWDMHRGDPIDTLDVGSGFAWSIALTRDGRRLAAAGSDGQIRVWDCSFPNRMPWKHSLVPMLSDRMTLQLDDDARRLAIGLTGQRLALVDVEQGTVKAEIQAEVTPHDPTSWESYRWQLAYSPGGRYLALKPPAASVEIWNLETLLPTCNRKLTSHVQVAAFLPGGTTAAGIIHGEPTMFVGLETGRLRSGRKLQRPPVAQLCTSPDRKLSAAVVGRELILWDTVTFDEKASCRLPPDSSPLDFSGDSQRLAIGSARSVLLNDVNDGGIESRLEFDGIVVDAAFTPDDQILAVLLDSGFVVIVDLATRQELCRFGGHGPRGVLEFLPDGQRLVVASCYPSESNLHLAVYSATAMPGTPGR